MVQSQVIMPNSRMGCGIVAVNQNGVQVQFTQVRDGQERPFLSEAWSLLDLEVDSGETNFKDYLAHCLRFAR